MCIVYSVYILHQINKNAKYASCFYFITGTIKRTTGVIDIPKLTK